MTGGLPYPALGREFGLLKIRKNNFGALDDRFRNPGEAGHLDAIAFVSAPFHDLAQEDDLVIPFPHSHVEVTKAGQTPGKFSEFVVMRGEESLRTDLVV